MIVISTKFKLLLGKLNPYYWHAMIRNHEAEKHWLIFFNFLDLLRMLMILECLLYMSECKKQTKCQKNSI